MECSGKRGRALVGQRQAQKAAGTVGEGAVGGRDSALGGRWRAWQKEFGAAERGASGHSKHERGTPNTRAVQTRG